MTQTLILWGLLAGIVGLLWVLVLAVVHDSRRAQSKKVTTF